MRTKLKFVVSIFLSILTLVTPSLSALSPEQKRAFDSGIRYFNSESGDCSAGGTTSLSGNDNAAKVWNFLIGKLADSSNPEEQAAGIMGNLEPESGFIPDNQENAVAFPNGGWGIAQWTGGRRDTLVAAVLAAGLPYTNEQTPPDQLDALLAFELDFLFNESNARQSRTYPDIKEWEGLKRQTTAKDAAYYWEYNFERPKVSGQQIRIDAAEKFLKLFGGTTGSTGTGTTTSGCGGTITGTGGANAEQDTSALTCPAGTTDAGVEQDYGPGRVPTVKIRLCDLPTVTQVNASIAKAALEMLTSLEAAGLSASGDSWRSYDEQAALRRKNGCPDVDISSSSTCRVPTARAGYGTHEVGLAIDFDNMCFPNSTCPSSAAWRWLMENGGTYGFKKNSAEAWHWSPTGN